MTDFLISTLPKLVNKLRGIILIPVVTKIIDSGAYGLWTNFAIGLTLVSSVASLSLGAATNKLLVDASEERIRGEFWAIIVVTFIVAVIVGGFMMLLQNPIAIVAFGGKEQSHLVVILAGVLLFSLFTRQSTQFYRSQRRMTVFAGVKSVRSVGEILVIIVAAIRFESILAIFVAYLLFHVVLSIVLGGYVVADFGVARPNFERIDHYLRFGVPLIATGMMYWVVNVSDRYLITYFHNVDVTGGYAVVYATASGLSIVSLAIGTVLFPDLASLHENNNIKEYRRRLSSVLEYFLILSIPATIGLIVIADPLLRVLSSTTVQGYTDLMYLLAPAMLAYGLFNILIQTLLSDGQSRGSAVLWTAVAIVNIGANFVLVPTYAATGASISTLGSLVFGLAVVVVWKRKRFTISLRVLSKVLIASALMGALSGEFSQLSIRLHWSDSQSLWQLALLCTELLAS
ncbi:oligosaccharide flippase family protein [Halovenus salina]|uniref:Oligosaccharide flippase family protein n=1 Tax=Halovenus salina TaxID=1510225 RepID=A0ABD5VZC3_9EURY